MTKQEIARIIKESRIAAGLTQMQVAEALERPQATIAGWEVGRSQPDANTLFELFVLFGRSVDEAFGFTKEPFAVTSIEREQIEKYRALDDYGKDAVSGLLDAEYRRCLEQADMEIASEIVYFSTPVFLSAMSAGDGQPAGEEYPADYKLIKEPPRGTSYIARVAGDSMDPTYKDGDLVFVHAQVDIPVGCVGVFLMDGQQWIKELGDGVLISHNATKYKPIPMQEGVRCQGLVLGVCDESYFE